MYWPVVNLIREGAQFKPGLFVPAWAHDAALQVERDKLPMVLDWLGISGLANIVMSFLLGEIKKDDTEVDIPPAPE
jgi:hypothetical protein